MGALKPFSTRIAAMLLCAVCTSYNACTYTAYAQPECGTCGNSYTGVPLSSLLLPGIMSQSYLLRDFVRNCFPRSAYSGPLPNEHAITTQLQTVDCLYLHALRLTDGDYIDALALCTLASLLQKNIPFTFGLRVPLTTESDSLYNERTTRIPRMLFCDTNKFGDADKLQHFFVSAYLTLATDTDALPDLAGLIVEWGEDSIVEGEIEDDRDVRANRLGQLFALRLEENPALLPSAIFQQWNWYGNAVFK